MRQNYIFVFLVIILAVVSGCTSESGTPVERINTDIPGYPAANTTVEPNTGYPGVTTGYPAISLEGFATHTPDPNQTPLIIRLSKTKDQEIISIVNITESELDISNFMVYAPLVDDRKIIPSSTMLEKNASYDIYNGEKDGVPEGNFWLTTSVINKVGDQLMLLNQAGRIIYYYNYYP